LKRKIETMTSKKDKFKEIIKNSAREDFIAGIHNYCDRWCEKCAFTHKCSVFAMEMEMFAGNEKSYELDEDFFDSISAMFKATMELVQEKMEELGITIDDIELEEDNSEHQERGITIKKLAEKYSHDVGNWLKENDLWVNEIMENDVNPNKLKDVLETIIYYHIFIAAKIDRAASGLNEDDEIYIYDMNGSAKIAGIAIERSIGAWGILLQQATQFEDDIYYFLKMLIELKKEIKMYFPGAESFIRPGFDE